MLESINPQTKSYTGYQGSARGIAFTSKSTMAGVVHAGSNPAKAKRNKILKTGFFVFLGVKIAMLCDIIFAKGKHLKALWNKIRGKK